MCLCYIGWSLQQGVSQKEVPHDDSYVGGLVRTTSLLVIGFGHCVSLCRCLFAQYEESSISHAGLLTASSREDQ